jgi:hypothetical protein
MNKLTLFNLAGQASNFKLKEGTIQLLNRSKARTKTFHLKYICLGVGERYFLVNLVKDDVNNRKKLPVGLGNRRRELTLTIVIKS